MMHGQGLSVDQKVTHRICLRDLIFSGYDQHVSSAQSLWFSAPLPNHGQRQSSCIFRRNPLQTHRAGD